MAGLTEKTCVPCKGGVPPLKEAEAQGLLEQTPGWALLDQGKRLERSFKFKNFREALDFVDRVGGLAEDEAHHPDITFGWGYATISLYTHKIKGLHENDFIMAAKINDLAPQVAPTG
jgi:4a-hydroxytetrahydrobiopterin dehydratase